MRWEKVQGNSLRGQGAAQQGQVELSGPGKRWGHSCNAIKGGRLLYVFGGYGKDNCHTNQVHVFDTVNQTWILPVIKGTPPIPRDSHSCTTVGDSLFVFGGTDGMSPLKDLHILYTATHTWISPTIRGEGPGAREGHSAALVGKRLYIFGGCGKSADNDNDIYYNDLYILNTETFVWKCAATSGTPPSPRDSHTCSSWKNKVVVIGGEDRHDYYLSDVHILDTDTLIWRELNASGQLLPPRAGHSTVSFGRNLFVFGGFADAQNLYNDLYMLDVDTGIWTWMATAGGGPSARFSVAGDCLDPFKGGVLVFIGGCNKNLEALDDMFYLYTGLARETEQRLLKIPLRKQLKLKCQEENLNHVQNRGLFRYGVGADVSQPMTVLDYCQPSRQNIPVNQSMPPGKIPFQANVTDIVSGGYTIETVIGGKPLRGILFSNKANFPRPATLTSSRKRTAAETDSIISDRMDPNKMKKLMLPSNPTAGASKPLKVSVNKLPEAVSLNQDDKPRSVAEDSRNEGAYDVSSSTIDVTTVDKANDMPSSRSDIPTDDKSIDVTCSITDDMPRSSAGVPADDKTNDAPISKTDVPTDDRSNDAPSSSADVPTNDKANEAPISKTDVRTDDRTNDVPSSGACAPTDDKTNDALMSEADVPTGDRTNDAQISNTDVLADEKTEDAPMSKVDVPTSDRTNGAPSSNTDVPTDDKTSDAPMSEADVPTGDRTNYASSSNTDVLTDDKTNDSKMSKADVRTCDRTNGAPSSNTDVPPDDKTNDAPMYEADVPTGDRTNDAPSSNTDVLTDDKTNDAPISETDVPTGYRTNDAPVSNSEVPRHDQASDEQFCGTEVLKPGAADSVPSLLNQDGAGPITEENNEPVK